MAQIEFFTQKADYYFAVYRDLTVDDKFVEHSLCIEPGTPKYPNDFLRSMGPKLISNSNVLFDLINLADEFLYQTESKGKIFLKRPIDEFTDRLVQFCETYGLPWISGDKSDKNLIFKNKSLIWNESHYKGFRVIDFMEILSFLSTQFHVWYALTIGDETTIKVLREFFIQEDMPIEFDGTLNDSELLKSTYVAAMMVPLLNLLNYRIAFIYDPKSKHNLLVPSTSNIFEVAFYQLAILIFENPEDSGIKECTCHRFFTITHGNQKLCPECQDHYGRNYMRTKRKNDKASNKIGHDVSKKYQ